MDGLLSFAVSINDVKQSILLAAEDFRQGSLGLTRGSLKQKARGCEDVEPWGLSKDRDYV